MRTKYIISEDKLPVVFSELQQHSDVARVVFPGLKIIGAGFVSVTDDGSYECYGESISLKVQSRGEKNSDILNYYLRGL